MGTLEGGLIQPHDYQAACGATEGQELSDHTDTHRAYWSHSLFEQRPGARLPLTCMPLRPGQRDSSPCHCAMQKVTKCGERLKKPPHGAAGYQDTGKETRESAAACQVIHAAARSPSICAG